MKLIVRTFVYALIAGTIGMIPMRAGAQANYPNKPIRFIAGVAPGGLIDVTARLVAQALSTRLGWSIVVENRAGANTTIGANAVRLAAPDGYTFFYGGVMSASPILVKNNNVDFVTQMKPVSLLLSAPFYVLVNSKVPVKTLEELAAYSKQHPGELNFADGAPLSTMVMHAIAESTGIKYTPIFYKGSAPSLNALIGGEVHLVCDTVPNYVQHIQSGKIRALVNTGNARLKALPDVPSGKEVKGIDFETASVLSLWAPPGTPDSIIQRVSDEIKAVTQVPEFRDKFQSVALVDPLGSTPAELLKAIESDKAFYTKVAKQIGYEPQ
jgi:tripartite-type tricarboxylate transporter receptor subunit TctC